MAAIGRQTCARRSPPADRWRISGDRDYEEGLKFLKETPPVATDAPMQKPTEPVKRGGKSRATEGLFEQLRNCAG